MEDKFNSVDIKGCDYTMNILTKSPGNKIVSYVHTKPTTCFYDIEAESSLAGYDIENKDRRWKWVDGQPDLNQPQYMHTYDTVMYNPDKVEQQLIRYVETGRKPLYTAGYMDGVIVFDLTKLPLDKVLTPQSQGGWMRQVWVADETVNGSKKSLKWRTFLPKPDNYNNYGKIVWNGISVTPKF